MSVWFCCLPLNKSSDMAYDMIYYFRSTNIQFWGYELSGDWHSVAISDVWVCLSLTFRSHVFTRTNICASVDVFQIAKTMDHGDLQLHMNSNIRAVLQTWPRAVSHTWWSAVRKKDSDRPWPLQIHNTFNNALIMEHSVKGTMTRHKIIKQCVFIHVDP